MEKGEGRDIARKYGIKILLYYLSMEMAKWFSKEWGIWMYQIF